MLSLMPYNKACNSTKTRNLNIDACELEISATSLVGRIKENHLSGFKLNRRNFARITTFFVAILILVVVYVISRQFYWQGEYERVSDRAALYNSTLVSALERYQHFPFVLARDPIVVAGLQEGGSAALNHRLEIFAKKSQVDALYIMNTEGLTIAASNWNKTPTYVGENYGFRQYFADAMAGTRGETFAIGVTTHLPGYFLAEPVLDDEGIVIGVVAMKVDLSRLTQSWSEGGGNLFVSNADGIIVLSSNPKWRYHSLSPLSAETRAAIEIERQFVNEALPLLNLTFLAKDEIQLDKIRYLHHISDVKNMNWKLHYLADKDVIIQRSQRAVLIATILMTILLAGYLMLRSERIKRALLASEEDSRGLRALNEDLEREIDDRRRAERRLERTQRELKQSSKLAALGQLAASVSHELGQPISAMQNYIAWADLPNSGVEGEARDVIHRLGRLTTRMAQTTKQLKFFAGAGRTGGVTGEDVFVDIDLRNVISGVREVMSGDFNTKQLNTNVQLPDHPCIVRGDRLRLEQVLINLIRNSLDAMRENDGKSLDIELFEEDGQAIINVLDRGPGIPDGMAEQIFDSFVTSKPSGEGMGLGLAISASIVQDHGGELKAKSRDSGGAKLTMTIPLSSQDQDEGATS